MSNALREKWLTPVIPIEFWAGPNLWAQHGSDLEALMQRYRGIFPDPDNLPIIEESYQKGAGRLPEKAYVTDNWGTVREFIFSGIDGMSKSYPLADWAALETYVPPDPLIHAERALRDWEALCKESEYNRKEGQLTRYYIGEFHERLYYLRGFQRYLMDLAEEPPQLARLIEMVLSFNERLIAKCLECGVNLFVFHDDLGTQNQLMMRPNTFRKWLKPGYVRMWAPIKAAGQYVYLHSDGMIREVLPDLIEVGLDVVNPQVAVNGIEEIAKICKGRICIKANLDDQHIIPLGSPQDVRDHVREVVMKLGSSQGGLGIEAKLIGPAPLQNLEALYSTVEEMRCFYA